MKMKNSEITKLMMEHSKKMRMSVKNPSETTLAAWRREDSKNEMILRYYER